MEVVALMAYGGDGERACGQMVHRALRLLSFTFVGTGATSQLGEEWTLLAVMTALSVWHRNRD